MAFGKRSQKNVSNHVETKDISSILARIPNDMGDNIDDNDSNINPGKNNPIEQFKKPSPNISKEDINDSSNSNDIKKEVFSALIQAVDISQLMSMERSVAEREIIDVVDGIISMHNAVLSATEQKSLVHEICNDILGYGPLESLLEDDDISDIMINGVNSCYIEVRGKIKKSNIKFRNEKHLLEICQRMVSKVGRRVDESSPICDARLSDGSRINVVIPPLALDGINLTIRKFKRESLTMDDLVKYKSMTKNIASLLRIIGRSRCNVIVSGGTSSGKTTLLNCISAAINTDERIITCEDSAELQLQQPHVIRLETRPINTEGKGEVTMKDLVKNCLRMRPERIIVGEVRGDEAFDLLQAMNTGHDGSMGTVHSNNPRETLLRLEGMLLSSGINIPVRTAREMLSTAIDVIIHMKRFPDGIRRITHVTEITGMEENVILTQDLVNMKMLGKNKSGEFDVKYLGSGVSYPKFTDKANMFDITSELFNTMTSFEINNE